MRNLTDKTIYDILTPLQRSMERGETSVFDFRDLFVFEMANNHQGSLEHGKKIIREMGVIAKKKNIRGAIKFQFRDLDTFIHPEFRRDKEAKHISRFLSTRLTESDFETLVKYARRQGLMTMATPFDEVSVDMIDRLGIQIIKVASCSAHDWPLLERIAQTDRPIIVSVGGLTLKEVDRVVSFFEHRGAHFALMHCVAVYPTPDKDLNLNQITLMLERYPHITIGFSTHESPDNTTAIALAYARGARIFEKHVGVATDTIKLNAYSADPTQVSHWIDAYRKARVSCGDDVERTIGTQEKKDLQTLLRGVYVKRKLKAGSIISRNDVFFAMPYQSGQMKSGRFKEGFTADRDYKKNEPLNAYIEPQRPYKRDIVYGAIREAKAMLAKARIPLNHEFSVEISHHFGLDKFQETGCMIIECINREYAKKLIIQFPGQKNPVHYHKEKDETFQVLFGSLEVVVEGKKRTLFPGDTLWVPRGVWHGFHTNTGVVFEEISTVAKGNDSYYVDKQIASIPRETRKTYLQNWGRHQFDEE